MSADRVTQGDNEEQPLRSRKRILAAFSGVSLVLPAACWFWGFTVDDALISARVADHIARGAGARFNLHGPLVDAVTPLGFAHLLAAFGRHGTWRIFLVSKALGIVAWLAAAGILALKISETGERRRRFAPLTVVAVSAPLAAWAASGMETGLVTLFATVGLGGGAPGALALGAAVAWRPELMPFAATLLVGDALTERESRSVMRGLLALAPALAVAATRLWLFGRAVPLSFYAKPSDFAHGLRYALGAFAFTGLPWLTLPSPRELARLAPRGRVLLAALGAHFVALILAGGDWMAMYRLLVPVLPCAALLGAQIAELSGTARCGARLVLALASAALVALGLGPAARRVTGDRERLMAAARPILARDRRIAALDVGWIGAQSDADVVDLAGVTDPEVAFFPGGHTSKRIPRAWLFAHRPDAIVLLLAPHAELSTPFEGSRFSRAVEQRVAKLVADDFQVRTTLGGSDLRYVVLEPKISVAP